MPLLPDGDAIADRYVARYDVFDDWGMIAYSNGGRNPWGDAPMEIDMGLWEQRLDDDTWAAFVDLSARLPRS